MEQQVDRQTSGEAIYGESIEVRSLAISKNKEKEA